MSTALWILFAQGVLGASDTLYYHELRARLPALGRRVRGELFLHAARDFIYAIVFGSLPWVAFRGAFTAALLVLLAAEIVITLADFVVEDTVRKPLGGVYPGERVMHALMGIVYGAFLANLAPILLTWWAQPTGLDAAPADVAPLLRWALTAMAGGVFLSGVRDLLAGLGVRHACFPYARAET